MSESPKTSQPPEVIFDHDAAGEVTKQETQLTEAEGSPTEAPWGRIVLLYSVLGGLCPLIPLPFVDDIILGFIKRRMTRSLCQMYGLLLDRAQTKILTRDPRGCPLGCIYTIVVYPIAKIFKKVFFFLSIKGCVDTASDLLHGGYLLHRALESGVVDQKTLDDPNKLVKVREAVLAACKTMDTRPINQILRRVFAGSKVLLRTTARSLWGLVRRVQKSAPRLEREEAVEAALEQAEGDNRSGLRQVLDELAREVWTQEGYLKDLECVFRNQLEDSTASPGSKSV